MSELCSEPYKPASSEDPPAHFFARTAPFLWRGLVLIATLVSIGFLLQRLGINTLFETGWIDSQVRGRGVAGGALFVMVGTAFTAIGLPRQVLSFLAGYAFGFAMGTGLALIATLTGAIATFQYARLMGRSFLVRHFPHRIKKIDDFLAGHTLTMTLVLRLSPFTNNLATNLAGGISGVRSVPFFIGSALGYLPQTLVFALLGSGFNLDPGLRTGLSIALFVISSFLGVWLWHRYRRGLPEDLPDADDPPDAGGE
ncbi:TVP38/TMEM64 family membrane protein [Gammaproteobacteria bacterium]